MAKAMQAYRKGGKHLILFDDVDVYLPIERDMAGQKAASPEILNRKVRN
jgi:hypothetical protein